MPIDYISKVVQRSRLAQMQFGMMRGPLRLLNSLATRLLDPYLIPSFGQFGEDRLISQYLGSVVSGTYVEVGCSHPRRLSNTWTLYQRGWTGLVIDANSRMVSKYKKTRPKDVAICAVVSESATRVEFYQCEESLISGMGPKNEGHWQRTNANSVVEKRWAVPLDGLIEEHLPRRRIDLLCVDVEGHELEVIRSFDVKKYTPRLIVVEIHSLHLIKAAESPVVEHLRTCGYELNAFDGVNGYFLESSP